MPTSLTSAPQGRKRSRLACETCRELKRKCDGAQPCGTCVRFEYDCSYERTPSHKRRKENGVNPGSATAGPASKSASASATTSLRSLEANSGAAFLRKLALRLDPKNAPRMDSFAWNAFLGSRKTAQTPTSRLITDMLSPNDMRSLAAVYFKKVHPIYGFIDRAHIEQQIEIRWATTIDGQMDEAVLCGIAALGCLFSQVEPSIVESDLVESARFRLEQSISDTPTAASITAWVLRVVYLRAAETHHMAWMASCILMHMVEAAGLHSEPSNESVLPLPLEQIDPEIRRRLLAVSQHLNIWTSFDMGRSRVLLCNATTIRPSPQEGDLTDEVMDLLPFSAELDPAKSHDASELECALLSILKRVHSSPPSILAQCNLTLCLCRRLQSMNACFTGTILEQILALTSKGIQAAQAILDDRAPWHHMANVPFQIVCVLLAMDTVQSIAQLKDAMQCLSNVAAVYNTEATREAMNTASLLILLHQRWKEKCAADLSSLLKLYPVVSHQDTPNEAPSQQPDDMRWLNNLAIDISSLNYTDFNRILFPEMLQNTFDVA
ncbi:hypothetical protein BGZ63DRAFT_488517 [Mariannaea sp. PMI_226]|nr:hypothetical protein BGZ63DRAFT_488517 [Mariannaea sp. PMI_226]